MNGYHRAATALMLVKLAFVGVCIGTTPAMIYAGTSGDAFMPLLLVQATAAIGSLALSPVINALERRGFRANRSTL